MTFATTNRGVTGRAADLNVAVALREFASFGADIDLTVQAGVVAGSIARGFMCTDAGAGTKKLVIVDASGTSVSIDCTNIVGTFVAAGLQTITGTGAVTTIARVLVFY